jgi:hypothetical protein
MCGVGPEQGFYEEFRAVRRLHSWIGSPIYAWCWAGTAGSALPDPPHVMNSLVETYWGAIESWSSMYGVMATPAAPGG